MAFIDLHVHLRGTLRPSLAAVLAARHGLPLPPAIGPDGQYRWADFTSFLQCYEAVTRVVRSASDLEEVAVDYLARAAAEGGVYVEFMLSPPDLERIGVAYVEQIAALEQARSRGLAMGIDSRLIVTAVRHLGPAAAVNAAGLAASRRTELVVGFGLTGDERQYAACDFAEAFAIARSADLRLTAHSGEYLDAATIVETVEVLNLDRVGHGIRAVESEAVLRYLANRQIPLEICLSSNLALGLYPDLEAHPLSKLAAAGCQVTLGTDDPGFFGSGIAGEYRLADAALGRSSTAEITAAAIDAAFCDAGAKQRLRACV
jgi:adenosine deaminase